MSLLRPIVRLSRTSPRGLVVSLASVTCVVWVLVPSLTGATIGLAEWTVYTPGGHLISRTDSFKDEHGICLRTDGSPGGEDVEILVSRMTRWRYYPNHVVGRDSTGFFIFDETTRVVRRFEREASFERALDTRRLGQPLSRWLEGGDGWREAWYPVLVWRPCRQLLGLDGATAAQRELARNLHSERECRDALDPELLELYRKTTWGRKCDEWGERGYPDRGHGALFRAFCVEITAPGP
jgi:hypothetical protein